MNNSIGIDIAEVKRIKDLVQRWEGRFVNRVFTQNEAEYCFKKGEVYRSLAARFAAKEAAFKALGSGWGQGVGWKDVEIVSKNGSKPQMVFHGRAKEMVGNREVTMSLSHTENYAVAVVLIQNVQER